MLYRIEVYDEEGETWQMYQEGFLTLDEAEELALQQDPPLYFRIYMYEDEGLPVRGPHGER
jgi:hypothetical protein